MMSCRLCGESSPALFLDADRKYFRCGTCFLVQVEEDAFLSPSDERREYDLHQNRVEDPAYRSFLSRLTEPLTQHLEPGAEGLDFGCGPGPALAAMMRESGFTMKVYDPFYAPDESVFEQSYDFITASEVVEHLHEPGRELDRLWGMLKPGGWLGIMTKRVRDLEAFRSWHYRRDPTHVCFFADESFQWLEKHWAAEFHAVGNDVALLRKDNTANERE